MQQTILFMTSCTSYWHLIPSFRHATLTSSDDNAPRK